MLRDFCLCLVSTSPLLPLSSEGLASIASSRPAPPLLAHARISELCDPAHPRTPGLISTTSSTISSRLCFCPLRRAPWIRLNPSTPKLHGLSCPVLLDHARPVQLIQPPHWPPPRRARLATQPPWSPRSFSTRIESTSSSGGESPATVNPPGSLCSALLWILDPGHRLAAVQCLLRAWYSPIQPCVASAVSPFALHRECLSMPVPDLT